jgi:hypothetical protein
VPMLASQQRAIDDWRYANQMLIERGLAARK